MNAEPSKQSDTGSQASLGTRLEKVCADFETQWRHALESGGKQPQIEDHLGDVTSEERWAFLRELILTDAQYRELAGELIDTQRYERRFPQFAELIPSLFRKDPSLQRIRDYRLIEVLGRGGMGIVYKAQHMRLGKTRAVKVLARHLLDNHEAVERFRLEIENTGRLDHPNIVQALDAGEENDLHFLVMEFVQGWDLSTLVEMSNRLPVDAACDMIRQASIGLQHAHDHFLVHRDIKPSNLMLSLTGQVKILDLGLSRFIAEQQPATRLTMSYGPMGTCDYMAPEQWDDASSVDIRADIYSLGGTLYYVLTGQPPFGGDKHRGAVQKQLAHQHGPIPSVLDTRPDVPKQLQTVLERMMAKSPKDRYDEPAEIIEDLAPYASRESTQSLVTSLTKGRSLQDPPTHPQLASSVHDTMRTPRKRAAAAQAAGRAKRRRMILIVAAILVLACSMIAWRLSRPPVPAPIPQDLVQDVVLLPGLNGRWWLEETPWFTPFVRTAVAEALQTEDVRMVLGDTPSLYLDPNVLRVQQWLIDATDRCRHMLSQRQSLLLDDLIAMSSERLEDVELEVRLRSSYEAFLEDRGEITADWSIEDLYTRALLEHRLAGLGNDLDMAQQALATYDATLRDLAEAGDPTSLLKELCQADSARLCSQLLSDHEEAFERFDKALTRNDAPALFQIETLAIYGHIGRTAGDYRKDEKFRLAKRILKDSDKIPGDHPLWAHVCERQAWSLMDQWNVKQAREDFEYAYTVRNINWKKYANPLAAIFVFHNLHGKAMTQRYLGEVPAARSEYEAVLAKINEQLEEVQQKTGQPGQQQLLRDLRERLTNSLERRADCELYEGAAASPTTVDLVSASSFYQQSIDLADDSSAKVAHACKQSLALALNGDSRAARQVLDRVSEQKIIGSGLERVRIAKSLAEAVLTLKEQGPVAGHPALRDFLIQFDLNPFDQLRRETLELQLLCAELLLTSQLASPETRSDAVEDLVYLEKLLQKFELLLKQHRTNQDMLPFLRRFYDLAITVVGDQDPHRAARLILTSRGPNEGGDSNAVRILFHLHKDNGLAVVLSPKGTSTAFKLDGWGRQHIKNAAVGEDNSQPRLPDELRSHVARYQSDGQDIECLWSDVNCWPASQRNRALTRNDFPLRETLDCR